MGTEVTTKAVHLPLVSILETLSEFSAYGCKLLAKEHSIGP